MLSGPSGVRYSPHSLAFPQPPMPPKRCAFCALPLEADVIMIEKCKHRFHLNCGVQYIMKQGECPTCYTPACISKSVAEKWGHRYLKQEENMSYDGPSCFLWWQEVHEQKARLYRALYDATLEPPPRPWPPRFVRSKWHLIVNIVFTVVLCILLYLALHDFPKGREAMAIFFGLFVIICWLFMLLWFWATG